MAERNCANRLTDRADYFVGRPAQARRLQSGRSHAMTTVRDDALAPVAVPGTRRWWALVALGLAVLAVGVDGTVLSVALPTLSKALKTTESNLQWFSSGYFLVLAAAILSLMLLKSPGFRPSPISDQRIMSIGNCKLKS